MEHICITPVFTAHPTEVARRSVMFKRRRISELLEELDELDKLEELEELDELEEELELLELELLLEDDVLDEAFLVTLEERLSWSNGLSGSTEKGPGSGSPVYGACL